MDNDRYYMLLWEYCSKGSLQVSLNNIQPHAPAPPLPPSPPSDLSFLCNAALLLGSKSAWCIANMSFKWLPNENVSWKQQ